MRIHIIMCLDRKGVITWGKKQCTYISIMENI